MLSILEYSGVLLIVMFPKTNVVNWIPLLSDVFLSVMAQPLKAIEYFVLRLRRYFLVGT